MSRVSNVLSFIQLNPGCSMRDIRDSLNCPRRSLYKLLQELINDNVIVKLDSLKDARMHHYYINEKLDIPILEM